jgi:hypothetical protein
MEKAKETLFFNPQRTTLQDDYRVEMNRGTVAVRAAATSG